MQMYLLDKPYVCGMHYYAVQRITAIIDMQYRRDNITHRLQIRLGDNASGRMLSKWCTHICATQCVMVGFVFQQ